MTLKIIVKQYGVDVDVLKIKESVDIVLKSGINYEFRTTVYPKFISKENVINIAKYLKSIDCKEYVLQQYYDITNRIKPYSQGKLDEMKKECEKYLPTKIKG